MQKTLIKAPFICAVLAISGVTYAGLNSFNPVEIFTEPSTGTLSAHGSLRDARNSADSTAYIGCTLFGFAGSANSMLCAALDAAGNFLGCTTSDPNLVQIGATINAATFLTFVVGADGSTCSRVWALQYSADL